MTGKDNEKLVLGIDEAGRGSVIGPLVIGGVLIPEKKIKFLERMGVKDSKRLTTKKRTVLSRKIKKITEFTTITITAKEIDEKRNNDINLNQIETDGINEIIKEMKPDICYVDCIDVNKNRFHEILQKSNPNTKIITEHKADDTYKIVSAASIIAKVTRDKELAIIRKKYGAVGSGYPSDKNTKKYLENIENNNFPPVVRKTWNTIKNIEEKKL